MQRTGEHGTLTDVPERTRNLSASVGLRWLTALIAMPVVLVFVWFGGWIAFAAGVLVISLALVELRAMLLHAGYRPLLLISFGLCLALLLSAMFPAQRSLILDVGIGAALLSAFLGLFLRKQLEGALIDWALTIAIAFYVGWPISLFLLLRGYDPGIVHLRSAPWIILPPGAWWMLLVLFGVWGFDGAAFFTGRYLGRHKLAPHISPGKTWEGVAGGLVLSVAAALLFTVRPLGVPWYLAVPLGLLIGIAAVIGDLAESLLKRQTHVKDSGQIMPGHGGMLDRMDSVLFAVVVVYIFAQFFGK